MNEWEQQPGLQAATPIARRGDTQMPEVSPPQSTMVERDQVDNVSCRTGDASCAAAHAAALSRSMRIDRAGAQRALLRMQTRYGNRYVRQVLNRASAEGQSEQDMTAIERSIDSARGSGHGMDHHTRTRMENAFGTDFSGVRIHTDAHSNDLNRSLNARAFTTGRDVFFRHGEYNPGASSGRELLAHELTHVVQQNGDGVQCKMTVSEPGDPHEVEADRVAHAVMQQEHAQPAGDMATSRDEDAAGTAVSRQPEAPGLQDDEEKKKKLQAKLKSELPLLERKGEPAE